MEVPSVKSKSLRCCRAVALAAAAVLCSGARPLCAKPAQKPKSLSYEQRSDLTQRLREVSREEPLSAKWYQAAERLLAFGPAGAKELLEKVDIRLRGLRRTYAQAFLAEARRLRDERIAKVCEKEGKSQRELDRELDEARETVLALAKGGKPDRNALRKQAGPIMKRLDDLMVSRRAEVLAGSKALGEQRERLRKLWALRDRCLTEAGWGAEGRLVALEQATCLMGMPANHAQRRTLEQNVRLAEKLSPTEADGIRDLNRIRLLLGLPALQIDLGLCRAARGHSTDMRTRKFFSHTSPIAGKESPGKRARLAGTTGGPENIATGTKTGPGAIRMWFHSPGHFRNMLGAHRRVGLGGDGGTWTQMFGR
jgi:hypothetical protein